MFTDWHSQALFTLCSISKLFLRYTIYLSQIFTIHAIFHTLYTIGITGGSHRLWAHKSYEASTFLKIVLMLLNSGIKYIILGANQGSIYHWSRDHRLHHKFSDTELDPHTIKNGFFFAHIGWLLKKKSERLIEEGRKICMDDLKADKVVMFQKKYNKYLNILMCFLIPSK